MAAGSFSVPVVSNTSQLINDTRFSSIREYVLDTSTLAGSTQLDITDLPANAVIYRIDLLILNAFSVTSGDQLNIEVTRENGDILMDNLWNDPNNVGTYTTNCYAILSGSSETLHILHDLGSAISGSAVLRFHLYTSGEDYVKLLTNQEEVYETVDTVDINLIKEES